ncbi:hypothetical protein [Agrobacterium tumefaciens]|uniref:hypothetical protein n=1 Tax=Agrobacterium tumefaciens TaxID=358 RepID=UPI0012DA6A72|nr:hypothetical protein [Agrobacterium tumefaciens]
MTAASCQVEIASYATITAEEGMVLRIFKTLRGGTLRGALAEESTDRPTCARAIERAEDEGSRAERMGIAAGIAQPDFPLRFRAKHDFQRKRFSNQGRTGWLFQT